MVVSVAAGIALVPTTASIKATIIDRQRDRIFTKGSGSVINLHQDDAGRSSVWASPPLCTPVFCLATAEAL